MTFERETTTVNTRIDTLSAGILRMRLVDGELRTIRMGGVDLIRRLYFCVRTRSWDTVNPKFTAYEVHTTRESFRVKFEAVCERPVGGGFETDAHFKWNGMIEGGPDGKITFTVEGEATADFQSNRIGLCLLIGTNELSGGSYKTSLLDTQVQESPFPALIATPLVIAPKFDTIAYSTQKSTHTITVKAVGATFEMEDQRHFGDSSFKAYAPLPFDYPNIPTGKRFKQVITLSVAGKPPARAAFVNESRITVSSVRTGHLVPTLRDWQESTPASRSFIDQVAKPAGLAELETIHWDYRPSLHLHDNETYWENAQAVVDQAATMRHHNKTAQLVISPLELDVPHPRPGRDPRTVDPFGAAWLAAFTGECGKAGIAAVDVRLGDGMAQKVMSILAPLAGQPLLETNNRSTGFFPDLMSWACRGSRGRTVVVINRTSQPQNVTVAGLAGNQVAVTRFSEQLGADKVKPRSILPIAQGAILFAMDPYEVLLVTETK